MSNELLTMQEEMTYALDHELPELREKYRKAIEFIRDTANDQDDRISPGHKVKAQILLRELGE